MIEERLVVCNYPSSCNEPLTDKEKKQVENMWGGIVKLPITSFKEYEMFKHIYGFDARFLSHHIYLPVIARLLNDYSYTKMFDDKGLLGFLGNSSLRFPYCYGRCINGEFYTDDMCQTSRLSVVDNCAEQDAVFIKPSKETSGGKGAQLLHLSGSKQQRKESVLKTLEGRKKDYVIQECICQHSVMSQFNETSINTFRITTLLLNGKFSLCSIILRFGQKGMKVDNWGAGGILVAVNEDGSLFEVGYDIKLNEYKSYNGVVFKDTVIEQMPMLIKQIEDAHTNHYALCKFIGWDVAIDKDGNPIILELNSSQPGVIGEQIMSGPIFGERTQEVIDYCKTKEFNF